MTMRSPHARDTGAPALMTDRALRRIEAEIVDGLRHGYFDIRVTCEVLGGGKRRVILYAGKTYQFVLSAESCIAIKPPGDPQDADITTRD